MSWINNSGRQQQSGPPLATTTLNNNITNNSISNVSNNNNTAIAATPIMAQTSSTTFGQQQQWSPHNKQVLQQQQNPLPSSSTQLNQLNSNWFNTTTASNLYPSSQMQHPQQLPNNNSAYFMKQQQQQNRSNVQQKLTDDHNNHQQFNNYQRQQQQQQQMNFSGQPQYQTVQNQSQQNYQQLQQSSLSSSNANEQQIASSVTTKVQQSSVGGGGSNEDNESFRGPLQTNDGWDDWEWNDNNNQIIQNQTDNQNIIEESFKTEPNDNWQWDVEEQQSTLSSLDKKLEVTTAKQRETESEIGSHQLLSLNSKSPFNNNVEEQDTKSIAATNLSSFSQTLTATSSTSSTGAYGVHHTSYNPVQQTVHSSPVNQQQKNVPSLDSSSTGDSNTIQQQQQGAISNVYVSQAKPVSQPTRQYAMSPPTGMNQSTPVNNLNMNANTLPLVQQPPIASINRKNSLTKTIANTTTTLPSAYPPNSQSPGLGSFPPPPPPSQTPPEHNPNFNSNSFPPPPPINQTNANVNANSAPNSNNPYKRSGQAQHHRSFISAPAKTQIPQVPVMPSQFFAPPPEDFRNAPPPKDFQNQAEQNLGMNQECLSPDNSEIVDRSFEVENLEVAPHTPNDDRNQYLQTSHLSEEDFGISNRQDENTRQELNNENDNFPPPGLSRLVLGQPEADSQQSSIILSEIPPGLDRMVPGTELSTCDLNMERQADGQDTMPSPRSAFTNVPPVEERESSNIDITTDRNLYLVPGESDINVQRVVTGVENGTPSGQSTEQRELEMDGENLEDQQQQQQHHDMSRDEPIEGANTQDAVIGNQNLNHETESSLTLEINAKDHSNVSTGNDESDNRERQASYFGKSQKRVEEKKRRNGGNEQEVHKRKGRYETEDSDLSSDRERRRYREGSAWNDRDKDRNIKDRDRREKREGSVRDIDRDRYRDDKEKDNRKYDRDRNKDKYDKERERSGKYGNRYENDLKYETEGSVRYERRRGDRDRDRDRDHDRDHDRDRDYDRDRGRDGDYRKSEERDRKYNRRDDRDSREREHERDNKRRGDDDDYYLDERRQRRRNRDYRNRDRGDRERDRDYGDKRDRGSNYDDDYSSRKSNSRNARDIDRDKDRTRDKDSRYSHMYGYHPNYGYDPYAYYQQQQQYYEQLRRTNPQLYAEWYRKYYGSSQQIQSNLVGIGATTTTTTDGRESVHSGRSSANDKQERYSLQSFHHSYYQQQHTPSDYHRQQQQHSLNLSLQYASNGGNLNQSQIISGDHDNGGNLTSGNLLKYQRQHYANNYMLPQNIGERSSYYAPSDYSESRPDNISMNLIDGTSVTTSTVQDPQRLTPCKFINEHTIASLSAGIMVCVKPKYTQNGGSITNVVKILKINGANDMQRRLFQQFPGPLVHGLTHKKTIIEFCEDQIRLGPPSLQTIRSRQNSSSSICSLGQQANKASFTLMWNLLILLLRQNGMVVGTDIAELLMKNKQQFPYEILSQSSITSQQQLKKNSNNNHRRGSVQSDTKKLNESDNDNDEENNDDNNDGSNSLNDDDQNSNETNSKVSLTEEEITEKFRNYLLYGNVNEALEWATDNNLWGHALFLASKVDRRLHANVMMKFANKLSLNDPLQTLYQMMSGRTPSSVTSVQDEKWGDWRPHLAMILSNTSQRPEIDRKSITTLGDSLYNRGDLFGAQFCYLMAQVGFNKYSSVNHDSMLMSNSSNVVRLVLLGSSQHKSFREFATNEAIMMTEIYEYACSLNDEKFSITEFQPYKYLLATRMLDYGYQLKTLMYMEQISLHIQRDPTRYDPSFIHKVLTLGDQLKYYDPVLEKTMDDQNNIENNNLQNGNNLQIPDQKWLQDLKHILNQYAANYFVKESTPSTMMGSSVGQQMIVTDNSHTNIDQQFAEINQQFSELNMQYNNFDPMQPAQQQQQNEFTQQQQQQFQTQGQDMNQQNVDQYNQYYNQSLSGNNSSHQQQNYDGLQSKNQEVVAGYGNEMNSMQLPYNQHQQQQQQQETYEQQQQHFHNESNQQMNSSYDYWNQQQQQNEQEDNKMQQNTSSSVQTSQPPLPPQLSLPQLPSSSSPSILNTASVNEIAKSIINDHKMGGTKSLNSNKNLIIDSNKNSISPQLKTKNSMKSNLKLKTDEIMESLNQSTTEPLISDTTTNYHHDNHQDPIPDISKPTISMPNSLSNKPGYFDDVKNEDLKSNQDISLAKSNNVSSDPVRNGTASSTATSKIDNKNQNKNSNQTSANSGWFGGIWNKLSLKPKNQMILPDDKNPTIVWDSEKKRWINTEGEGDEQESFKPPPKMSDLMTSSSSPSAANYHNPPSHSTPPPPAITPSSSPALPSTFQHQQQQSVPLMNPLNPMSAQATTPMSAQATTPMSGNNESNTKPPSLQSNMFKMQRNRTLKKSYVDVFNPSGAPSKPVEPVLAPTLPPVNVPQSGFFVPGPADDNQQTQVQQQQSQEQNVPQFYNPNQFTGY